MKTIGSLVLLVVVVVLVACGSKEAEPKSVANAERPSCASAADCTMSTFCGCCSCCEAAPKAMLKSELDRQQGQCAVVDCKKQCKEDVECPKNERLDAFTAICKSGTCQPPIVIMLCNNDKKPVKPACNADGTPKDEEEWKKKGLGFHK